MSNNDIIRRYKHQRRRNAKTIRERNETIRRLEAMAQVLKEVVDDYQLIVRILGKVIAELQERKP